MQMTRQVPYSGDCVRGTINHNVLWVTGIDFAGFRSSSLLSNSSSVKQPRGLNAKGREGETEREREREREKIDG